MGSDARFSQVMKPESYRCRQVMEAISEKVMPSGVMPAYSRQVMTPIEHAYAACTQQPQEVIGSSSRE